jgi:hypothetical protein
MTSQATEPMRYDPVTGAVAPQPEMAEAYRVHHGPVAWLYNPWTREKRDARDIGTDVLGLLIVPVKPMGRQEQRKKLWIHRLMQGGTHFEISNLVGETMALVPIHLNENAMEEIVRAHNRSFED